MKFRILWLLFITLPGGCLGQAQQPQASLKSLEEALISNERLTWELYKNKDAQGLSEYTSEDYVDIYPDGKIVNKEQYLRDVSEVQVYEYALSDFKVVKLNDDAAIVVYQAKVRGTFKGKEIRSQVAVTSGWAKRNGKWLNVFYRENVIELNGRKIL